MSAQRTEFCPHCQQNTLVYLDAVSGHCINRECPGHMLTLPVEQFKRLTADDLESYARAGRASADLETPEEKERARRMAATLEALARIEQRKSERRPDEKTYC